MLNRVICDKNGRAEREEEQLGASPAFVGTHRHEVVSGTCGATMASRGVQVGSGNDKNEEKWQNYDNQLKLGNKAEGCPGTSCAHLVVWAGSLFTL